MIKDAVGLEIKVGSDVIYNMSGSLAYGKVEKITEKLTKNAFHPCFNHIVHIRYVDGVSKYGKNKHVSKVGNTEGIIVIG